MGAVNIDQCYRDCEMDWICVPVAYHLSNNLLYEFIVMRHIFNQSQTIVFLSLLHFVSYFYRLTTSKRGYVLLIKS